MVKEKVRYTFMMHGREYSAENVYCINFLSSRSWFMLEIDLYQLKLTNVQMNKVLTG